MQQAGNVGVVAGQHVGPPVCRGLRHHGIDYITRAGTPEQLSSGMRAAFGQVHHLAAAQ